MFRDQSTIADAVSKEVEWLENISNSYSAGKSETETRSVNASKDTEKAIKTYSPK